MKNPIDSNAISKLMIACAETYIKPRYKKLSDNEVSSKTSPQDLVTIADIETEIAMTKHLTSLYPGSTVIGEEAVSKGHTSLEDIKKSEGIVWVIDPVDGTNNFVHGKRDFCMMLACVIDGETRMSWIYDVLSGKMAYAEKGKGATFDKEAMAVANKKNNPDHKGFVGIHYFPKDKRPYIKEKIDKVGKATTLQCAGHEYLKIAAGQVDFAIYSRIKPWDHLAGSLLVEEAGGHICKWDGSPYRPKDYHDPAKNLPCGLVIASQHDLMRRMQKTVTSILKKRNDLKP